MSDAFEVGNTVYAMNRVTTVEKVYANGNFKLVGINGQWRQGGWKTGDHGYYTPRCLHYTEKVAAKVAHERATVRLCNAVYDLSQASRSAIKHLAAEQIDDLTAKLRDVLAALVPQPTPGEEDKP